MSTIKQHFNITKRIRVLPKEPYEMTYWKEKLQSPFYKLQKELKNLWTIMFNSSTPPLT